MKLDNEFKKILKPIFYILISIFVFSIVLYFLAELEGIADVTFLKSLYMVVITLSTVGYGDIFETQNSVVLTAFNTIAIFTYMGMVAYAISNFTAFLIEGRLGRYFQTKKTIKRIKKMDNHYIICGAEDIGIFVAKELYETKRPFVVIEENISVIEKLTKDIPNLLYIQGDPTEDSILLQAGITKAKALIAALGNEKENIYLVVAAKELNKNIQVAAKFESPKNRSKFLKAGASYMVSPSMIGGLRVASELIRPQVVSFLDRMLRSKTQEAIRVEEVVITEDSNFIKRTIRDFTRETKMTVISIFDPAKQDFVYNPPLDQTIVAEMTLVFIATPDQRISVERKVLNQ